MQRFGKQYKYINLYIIKICFVYTGLGFNRSAPVVNDVMDRWTNDEGSAGTWCTPDLHHVLSGNYSHILGRNVYLALKSQHGYIEINIKRAYHPLWSCFASVVSVVLSLSCYVFVIIEHLEHLQKVEGCFSLVITTLVVMLCWY